jgi:hypothetical protein
MMNVFAPSIRGEIEILRQQIGQLSRGLSREDALHDILVVGISFRLMQKNPLTRLRAENVLVSVVDEDPRSVLARATQKLTRPWINNFRVVDYLGATRRALNPPLDFKSELGLVNLHRGELNLLS